ncbi:MAG: efflux RND transporter periplasmic adaptor subunit [Nitrospirae bacterium]|nr:efflux RND transporter periplasmic adaptor subunit [Nitrospirota bacterium]
MIRKMSRFLIGGVIGVGVMAALAAVVSHSVRTNPPVARAVDAGIPVRVVPAEVKVLTDVVGAGGEVEPLSYVKLTARLNERIEEVATDVGKIVKADQKLIRFDTMLLITAVVSARDNVAKTRTAMKNSRLRLERITDSLQAAVNTARDNVIKAETALENGRLHLSRIKTLYEQGLVAKADVEEAQLQHETAGAQHSDAILQLIKAEDHAKADVEEAQLQHETAKAQHSEALHQQGEAQRSLDASTVKAPVSGMVTERFVNPGETPKMDAPLLTLGRLDSALLAARVAEEKIASVHMGQSAEIDFSAFPGQTLRGTVWKIDPNIDGKTKTFIAYIKLKNEDLRLKPGMTGFARIRNQRSTVAVPSVAVINPVKDQPMLFVVDKNNIARLKRVQIGVIAEGMTEVISGVKEKDLVVSVGQLKLRDNDRVRIATEKFE